MRELIQPKPLQPGDKVAAVSLSWGGAGDPVIRDRYETAKKRLKSEFGLELVPMPHALKGTAFVNEHPELRAKDWMDAYKDPEIKGIISCIGGDDTIRLLPYVDYEVIRENPKIFMGYSDTTINHLMCLKAGVSSLYGPCLLMEFGENVDMHRYTVEHIKKALFSDQPLGNIVSSPRWTSERLEWNIPENNQIQRIMCTEAYGYEVLQGSGMTSGHLIGGCIEVLDWARGTEIWPDQVMWDGSIVFLETSEDTPEPGMVRYMLRCLVATGALDRASGIVFAKPYDEKYYDDYKDVLLDVIAKEAGLIDLPILYNMNFGHTAPMFPIPYGAIGEIDCDQKRFCIK